MVRVALLIFFMYPCQDLSYSVALSSFTEQCVYTIQDPEWKFSVFLRDPAERLLSAYLDKVNGTQRDKDHFLMNYNMTVTPSFAEFVHAISKNRTATEIGVKSKEKLHGVDWCKCLCHVEILYCIVTCWDCITLTNTVHISFFLQ